MAEGRVKEVIVDSRINKVLSMRIDSASMVDSFDAISSFYVENTVEARRSLRQDLELKNILLAKKFLAEFDVIKDQVIRVEESSSKLEVSCKQLAQKVSTADENMKQFMKRAAELDNLRNFNLKQSEEISSFLRRFQLSRAEIDALHLSSLDDRFGAKEFFDAFQRLKTAYVDCKSMVESNNYTAGFELLDSLGLHQDTAYRRLFEWVKGKCEGLAENVVATQDIDIQLQFAIRSLRTLPMYFAQCQDLIVNSRRSQLVQKFVIALTQGGTSGQVFRAIDLHCHDPVRYIGDMLAWMHQTVVSEEEYLDAIFGDADEDQQQQRRPLRNESSGGSGGSTAAAVEQVNVAVTNDDNEGSNSKPSSNPMGLSVQEMLVRCLQGLGRPLRLRITQTLESHSSVASGGAEVLYSLTDLLAFYEHTFTKLVRLENAVHSAVKGSLQECKRLFLLVLNQQAELLVQCVASAVLDLTPTAVTRDCAKQIREVLRVHNAALSSVPSDISDTCYIDTVLGSIIQPLLQGCRVTGQTLGQGDMAIFMLNNVSTIKSEVSEGLRRLYSSSVDRKNLSQWMELLDTESRAWLDVAAADEAGRVLKRSDMDKLLELIEVLPRGITASEQAGLSQDRIDTVMRAFYASLLSTSNTLFDRIIDAELRELARLKTVTIVADAHSKVYAFVAMTSNKYDKSALLHTDAEVRVLLQIDEHQQLQ